METKKPTIEDFRKALAASGGNLTNTAKVLKCGRTAIWKWAKSDEEFANAIDESRMRVFDRCLSTAQILAFGVPKKDDSGDVVGWIERPDSGMLRYFMSTLGRREGFGEKPEDVCEVPTNVQKGVPIEVWINHEMGVDDTTETD